MKKKFFLTFMAVLTSVMSWGYAVNETFYRYISNGEYDETILYYVVDADPTNLCCGVALCTATGAVTIPDYVFTDQNVTFKVTTSCAISNSAILNEYGQPYSADITSLTFSEGLTTLNVAGFNDCGAKTLSLPSTLTTINSERNEFCPYLHTITIADGSSYQVVQSSEGADCILSSDGTDLVHACRYVEGTETAAPTLTFPAGVKTCNSYLMCQTYTDVSHPYIKQVNLDAAFESYYINESLNETAFSGNSYFETFTVDAGNTTYCAYNGILYKDLYATYNGEQQQFGKTLVCCPQGKYNENSSFIVPKGVVTIGKFAFLNCRAKVIKIYSPIATLELGAFYNCSYLNPTDGFNFPASVTSIAEKALSSCSSLTTITVNSNNKNYIADNGVLYTKDYTTLLTCPAAKTGDYTVNSATVTIAKAAFASSQLTNVYLSGATGLTTISESAFSGASTITSLEIPASVTWMGYRSLGDMASLATLTFDGTKDSPNLNVDDRWFSGTNQVTNLVLPANLVSIATNSTTVRNRTAINATNISFAAGSKLTSIKGFESSFNGRVRTIDLSNCTSLTSLPEDFCANLTKLTSVTLPPNVETISSRAFFNTTKCTTVTFPENSTVKTIGANAFQQCGVTSITLPTTVETIDKEAFAYCTKLQTVGIPESTTTISPEAFKFCTKLTKFTVDTDNSNYAALDGIIFSKDKKTLKIFPPGKARDTFTLLPPSFETIGEYSFYYCLNLKNIVIPKKVTKIENFAFEFCNNLNSITFLTDAPPSQLEADVATDEQTAADYHTAHPDDGTWTNYKDHRFGNADESPSEFLKNHVIINIRTNGNEDDYTKDGSYWKDCAGYTYSFKADSKNSEGVDQFGRTDITNSYDYLAMSDNTVGVLKSYSTCNTAVVPATVTNPDNGKSYSVGMIADYAFEDISENVKEMVFLGPIEYVGSNAFNNGHYDANNNGKIDADEYHEVPTSNIENIFFTDYKNTGANELSTVRFELGSAYGTEEYPEFASTQNIYVPRSKLSTYQTAWPAFSEKIAYKIPLGMSATSEYSTFSREFDVDFRNCDNGTRSGVTGANRFLAFTGKTHNITGDYIGIQMISINCTEETTSEAGITNDCDGTYIPANTGVLIKNYVTTSKSRIYYYRIGEKDKDYKGKTFPTTSGVQIFKPVVEDEITWTTDADVANKYYISGGKYYTCYSEMTMPVHKSYIDVDEALPEGSSSGAKTIKLIWNDSDVSATAIQDVVTEQSQDAIYDISGRRVQNTSAKGLYIVNGKKVMIK